jgi:hypothetical protein
MSTKLSRCLGLLAKSPSLVAGRLQHERKIPFSRVNQLKRLLDFGD